MLGADAGVVQPGRDRVRLDGLAVLVLEHVGAGTVLINLSGRGDKDMGTAIEWFGLGDPDKVTEEPVGDPDSDPRAEEVEA